MRFGLIGKLLQILFCEETEEPIGLQKRVSHTEDNAVPPDEAQNPEDDDLTGMGWGVYEVTFWGERIYHPYRVPRFLAPSVDARTEVLLEASREAARQKKAAQQAAAAAQKAASAGPLQISGHEPPSLTNPPPCPGQPPHIDQPPCTGPLPQMNQHPDTAPPPYTNPTASFPPVEEDENLSADFAAAIIWQDNKLLVCRRGGGVENAYQWEFPGDFIRENETDLECVTRVCREKLDIDIAVCGHPERIEMPCGNDTLQLQYFGVQIVRGDPYPIEYVDLNWIYPAQLPGYDMWKIHAIAMQRLCAPYNIVS